MNITEISHAQLEIFRRGRRQVIYYVGERPKGLIPNTQNALKWAVEKHGATHLSNYTYRSGSKHRIGNFYCVISGKEKCAIDKGMKLECSKFGTADVAFRAQSLLSLVFHVEKVNCVCIYLGPLTFGVFIPASAFGEEDGAIYLDDLYHEAFIRLSANAGLFELEVTYPRIIPIENTRLPSCIFAVPFLIDEVSRLSKPLEDLAVTPRSALHFNTEWRINPDKLADMKREAVSRTQSRHRRFRNAWWPRHPEREHLANSESVLSCSSVHARAAQKCAQKLLDWIAREKLTEFSQRDAQREVRQRRDGPGGVGGGVADALHILSKAHYIRKYPTPSMKYLCKPASPWFLVNPLLHESIEPRRT